MSRNQFELLLRMWHFINNESQPENDRLYKFCVVVEHLLDCLPQVTMCIDDTIVDQVVPVSRRNGIVNKPKPILDYNKGKAAIDLSDQLASYSTPRRRSLKWYCKLGKQTTITNFRKALIKLIMTLNIVPELQNKHEMPAPQTTPTVRTKMMSKHIFRKRKVLQEMVASTVAVAIKENKVKKVTTYYVDCLGELRYCLECVNSVRKPWWTQYKAKSGVRAAIWRQRHVLYNSGERTPVSTMALWDILGGDTGVHHGSQRVQSITYC
ncbi:hypothetical protein PR048_008661 [Dryococelus australis]|uniref:PiggyBac transposable element-derived protein domain-containing protein n=1 Tax=Dryococelus australis TaxID=614101 RepID=A0ABQ9HXQ3_9NEOP|nr:hypothetical protein PR048_008661 [Dryococelus australis]